MSQSTSPSHGHDWRWVSVGSPDSARRIKIPPALRDDGIFNRFDEVHWSYSLDSGAIVISAEPLVHDRYHTVESRSIGSAKDNYRAQVPHQFFPDGSGEAYLRAQKTACHLEGTETFHFVYHQGVKNTRVPFCFVLTTIQLEQRLKHPEAWPGLVSPKPKITREYHRR